MKHGFYSKDKDLNPDNHSLRHELSSDDLVYAERFLSGVTISDPVRAHGIVKSIYQAGKRRYPTLWEKAQKHVHGYEYESLERLSHAPRKIGDPR